MTIINFKTAKELKQAVKTGFGFTTPKFTESEIKSINGIEFGSLSPDVTNSCVRYYNVDKQDTFIISAPYTIILK